MLVSALVLTLDDNAAVVRPLLGHLAADTRLQLGTLVDHRLPVVAEVADPDAGERLCEELQQTPGVRFVDVVMVDASLALDAEAA